MVPTGSIREILGSKGSTVWTISPDATVFEAIQMMADKNVGSLLVTDQGKLKGVISERDYTRKVILKGKSSRETAVKEILSGHVMFSMHAVEMYPGWIAPSFTWKMLVLTINARSVRKALFRFKALYRVIRSPAPEATLHVLSPVRDSTIEGTI